LPAVEGFPARGRLAQGTPPQASGAGAEALAAAGVAGAFFAF